MCAWRARCAWTRTGEDTPFVPGKANVLREGGDVAIVATGLMVQRALAAAEMLAQEGIQAAVLNVHTIKPYDAQTVLEWAESVAPLSRRKSIR